MGLFEEMLDFITLENKIKYQKAKNSKMKVNFKSKDWDSYSCMPEDYINTKHNTLQLVLIKTTRMNSGNIKRIIMYKCTYTERILPDVNIFFL